MIARHRYVEPNDDLGRTVPLSEADAIARGQEAWERHKTDATWADWLAIGEALLIGRRDAMAAAGTNEPSGSVYNHKFGSWLEGHGFGDFDKSDRAKLFKVMDNRAAIELWRSMLPATTRLRLNHPTAVWRRWQAATKPPAAQSTRPTLRDRVANLTQENAALAAQVEEAEAACDLGDWHADDLDGLVSALLVMIQSTPRAELAIDNEKLRELADLLIKLSKTEIEASAPMVTH